MVKDDKKNVIMGILLIAIITMAIGYAALSQQLKITGTANVGGNWDIRMINITEGTASNSAGLKPTATNITPAIIESNTTASFNVGFQTPGDTMEYDVTVKNNGTINAKLTNIILAATDNEDNPIDLTEVKGINYVVTIDGKSVEEAKNTVINSNSESIVHVKVYWDQAATEIPLNVTKKLTMTLDYTQA